MNLTEFQAGHAEFIERSKDRARQKSILKELFQSRQMKVAMFNHMNRLVDSEQRKDERMTGFRFASIYDGKERSSPTFHAA